MAVQEGRSKDRVVRLEPFFTDAPVASAIGAVSDAPETRKTPVNPGERRRQAARDAGREAAAVVSNRTLTRLETPDSSMVTP